MAERSRATKRRPTHDRRKSHRISRDVRSDRIRCPQDRFGVVFMGTVVGLRDMVWMMIDLLRGLSYIGGLFGYMVMAYVLADWLGDVVWR